MGIEHWRPTRRDLVKAPALMALASTASPVISLAQALLRRTPEQILGPFYPLGVSPILSGDLTMLPGHAARAKGQLLVVMGQVLNTSGEPVRGARVEIWQANGQGRYAHPSDTNAAPLDPNFEGFGVALTNADGRYRFKTIKPAAYPTGPTRFVPHTFTSKSAVVVTGSSPRCTLTAIRTTRRTGSCRASGALKR